MSTRHAIQIRLLFLGALLSLGGCQTSTIPVSEMEKPIVLTPRTVPSRLAAAPTIFPTPIPIIASPLEHEKALTGSEVGLAEVELPKLLGELWYPDAGLSLRSERGEGNRGHWPKVTLLVPKDEKIRGVLDYYELHFPGGERKNNEYIAEALRPGDETRTRLHIFRATRGSDSGRIVIRLQS